jgi:tripartite-type tricarboxylate transporter receptor subunit TctC
MDERGKIVRQMVPKQVLPSHAEKEGLMKRLVLLIPFLSFMAYVLLIGVPSLQAQPYPNHPIQLVVPNVAGSAMDIPARILAEDMGKVLGVQIIPMNKPGGGTVLGTDVVARSKKDGYTLGYASNAALVNAPIINPESVSYDPLKDLEPLGLHIFFPLAIAVQESSPWKTFGEWIDYAKKNPGKIRVSTMGLGSGPHFNLEIIQSLTGVQLTHVPFKGGESVITAVLGGHVEATSDQIAKIIPHVETGKMRVLLVSKKSLKYPNIPTMTELGYNQELLSGWFGLFAPAGLPEDVKRVLIPAIENAIKNPEARARIEKMEGFFVDYKSPAELKKFIIEDYQKNLAIALKLGLRK